MTDGTKGYWRLVETVWDEIDIYESEQVFLSTYAKADRNAGLLFAAHFAQSEICNGGFNQFFWNSTGVLASEAVEGMQLIGMSETAKIIASAMQVFGEPYPRGRGPRQFKLEGVDKLALDALDKEFFRLIASEAGGFVIAADAFVKHLLRK